MLLKDYREWKDKMENKQLPGKIEYLPGTGDSNVNMIARPDLKIDITSFVEHSVIFLRSKGPSGLYYNANIIVSIKDSYQRELDGVISNRDYWRSRCEDIQTSYNLQQRNLERFEQSLHESEEKIKILSEALTRSKAQEKGKKVYISRLQNQLEGKSSRRPR